MIGLILLLLALWLACEICGRDLASPPPADTPTGPTAGATAIQPSRLKSGVASPT